jgi:hypothetical protein
MQKEIKQLADLINLENQQGVAEIKEDLVRLMAPKITGTAIQETLGRMLEKINNAGLSMPRWEVSPAKGRSAMLKLGRTGWAITPIFEDLPTPVAKLYSLLLAVCIDGSLACLRRCEWCKGFFSLGHSNEKFCGKKCSKAFSDAGRAKRQSDYRRRKDIRCFERFLDALPEERLLFQTRGARDLVEKWQQARKLGKPVEEIWDKIRKRVKGHLRSSLSYFS